MWTITGALVAPHLPSYGFCASLDAANAKFAETWRAWFPESGPDQGKFRCHGSANSGHGPFWDVK